MTVSNPLDRPKLIKLSNLFKKTDEETPVIALITRQTNATKIRDLLFLNKMDKSLFKVPFFAFGRGPDVLPVRPACIGNDLAIVVTYLVLRVIKFLVYFA